MSVLFLLFILAIINFNENKGGEEGEVSYLAVVKKCGF